MAPSDPEEFGSVLAAVLPLDVHCWDRPKRDEPFFNQSGLLRFGDLTLLSTLGSAIHGEVEQKAEAQLVIPYGSGHHHYRVEQSHFRFRTSCLFMPSLGARVQITSSICAATIISFPSDSLWAVARAIGGPDVDGLACRVALEQPAILSRRADPRRNRLHGLLLETLAYVEQCLLVGGSIHPMLCLDDLIRRLVVLLLLPDLLEMPPAAPQISEPFVHQGLVDWLLAHLHEPVRLSDLEQRSHYSRRSLQQAFKQRFGCGPMQWLRQQRLSRAKLLLEQPGFRGSLLEVAQACGYLSAASFSRDFAARYGERPVRLLRRFRERNLSRRLDPSAPGIPFDGLLFGDP